MTALEQESERLPRELKSHAPTIGVVQPRPHAPVDPGVRHPRPAVLADAGATTTHLFAGASLVGASHQAVGSPRQDSFAVVALPGGGLVVAVADGLGSRASSQVGAETFCQQVVALAPTDPGSPAERLLLAAAESTARVLLDSWQMSPRDGAFVGLVLVVDDTSIQMARVGDVSAFELDPSGSFRELFPAPEGPLNTVDAALPSAEGTAVDVASAAGDATVLVASDGLALDVRMSAGARAWMAECWQGPVDAFAMVDCLRYQRQGSLDDRTAVVIWPRSRRSNTPDEPVIPAGVEIKERIDD